MKIPGLTWRDGRARFDRRHRKFAGGRLAISLRTSDPMVAVQRHGVLQQLMDRGDWQVLEAIRAGDIDITEAVEALREGEPKKLRRLGKDRPKLGPAADRFLRRTEATSAPATYSQYGAVCGLAVQHFGADCAMDEIGVAEAEAYLHQPKAHTSMGGEVWAPRSQRAHATILGALWRMVIREEVEASERRGVLPVLTSNPWGHARTATVRQTRVAFLTHREYRDLDQVLVGKPHRVLVGVACLAGLRQQEIAHLRPGVDVLLDQPKPLIRVQSRLGEHPWRPKTDNSERDVPVVPHLAEIIREHQRLGFAGDRYLVRASRSDRPLSARTAIAWTEQAFCDAGIRYGREGDGLTLHSLRHTFASWMAQDGVALNIIADLLGDTLKVVHQTYVHLVPRTYEQAVESVARATIKGL